jgi:rubrerythrin
VNEEQIHELLYQALETEMGGVEVYQTALRCVENEELKEEWKDAHQQVEEEEDEHLYHTAGWSRELWVQSLGMPAVLPPPEEEKDVKTAIGAARAKQERGRMKKAS